MRIKLITSILIMIVSHFTMAENFNFMRTMFDGEKVDARCLSVALSQRENGISLLEAFNKEFNCNTISDPMKMCDCIKNYKSLEKDSHNKKEQFKFIKWRLKESLAKQKAENSLNPKVLSKLNNIHELDQVYTNGEQNCYPDLKSENTSKVEDSYNKVIRKKFNESRNQFVNYNEKDRNEVKELDHKLVLQLREAFNDSRSQYRSRSRDENFEDELFNNLISKVASSSKNKKSPLYKLIINNDGSFPEFLKEIVNPTGYGLELDNSKESVLKDLKGSLIKKSKDACNKINESLSTMSNDEVDRLVNQDLQDYFNFDFSNSLTEFRKLINSFLEREGLNSNLGQGHELSASERHVNNEFNHQMNRFFCYEAHEMDSCGEDLSPEQKLIYEKASKRNSAIAVEVREIDEQILSNESEAKKLNKQINKHLFRERLLEHRLIAVKHLLTGRPLKDWEANNKNILGIIKELDNPTPESLKIMLKGISRDKSKLKKKIEEKKDRVNVLKNQLEIINENRKSLVGEYNQNNEVMDELAGEGSAARENASTGAKISGTTPSTTPSNSSNVSSSGTTFVRGGSTKQSRNSAAARARTRSRSKATTKAADPDFDKKENFFKAEKGFMSELLDDMGKADFGPGPKEEGNVFEKFTNLSQLQDKDGSKSQVSNIVSPEALKSGSDKEKDEVTGKYDSDQVALNSNLERLQKRIAEQDAEINRLKNSKNGDTSKESKLKKEYDATLAEFNQVKDELAKAKEEPQTPQTNTSTRSFSPSDNSQRIGSSQRTRNQNTQGQAPSVDSGPVGSRQGDAARAPSSTTSYQGSNLTLDSTQAGSSSGSSFSLTAIPSSIDSNSVDERIVKLNVNLSSIPEDQKEAFLKGLFKDGEKSVILESPNGEKMLVSNNKLINSLKTNAKEKEKAPAVSREISSHADLIHRLEESKKIDNKAKTKSE